ncbi:hypothetical protein B0H11DRAFT_724555 [Mycena galericulata]|nr:hypothetical protein B0H11DRAFT_724555 [Mycena galericulata]
MRSTSCLYYCSCCITILFSGPASSHYRTFPIVLLFSINATLYFSTCTVLYFPCLSFGRVYIVHQRMEWHLITTANQDGHECTQSTLRELCDPSVHRPLISPHR